MTIRLEKRWIMTAVLGLFLLGDCAITLLGQPHAYWMDHSVTNEASPVWNYFLRVSPLSYICGFIVYWIAASIVASILPRILSLLYVTTIIYMHSSAIDRWLIWHFRFGWWTELWFAPVVASAILATYCCERPQTERTPAGRTPAGLPLEERTETERGCSHEDTKKRG